jgi:hypothetical protein
MITFRNLICLFMLATLPLGAFGTDFQTQRLAAPPPCKRKRPAPSASETQRIFGKFVQAFVGPNKNISEAFTYIAVDYIVSLLYSCGYFKPKEYL